jgi:hypothetical protein
MEPEQGTEDYGIWEAAMNEVTGKAEHILALSRENEFPRRRAVRLTGATTGYGPDFKQQFDVRGFLWRRFYFNTWASAAAAIKASRAFSICAIWFIASTQRRLAASR